VEARCHAARRRAAAIVGPLLVGAALSTLEWTRAVGDPIAVSLQQATSSRNALIQPTATTRSRSTPICRNARRDG
jgi:hypothetical protein